MARLFTIKDNDSKRTVMAAVWDFVSDAIHSGGLDITVAQESKTRLQEAKYHSMIGDIARQVEFDGKRFDVAVWKVKLKDQFEHELIAMGTPLSKPGRVTMSIDQLRVVQIPPESRQFRKKEAHDFVEYLYSFASDYDVVWTDPETKAAHAEYMKMGLS